MSTPNMGLDYPSPSVTIGPLWASLLNACLDLVDTHDHTATHGVKVPTAGLNINADLSMGSFNLTTIRGVRLNDQVATLNTAGDLRIIYAKNGELTYRDGAGNEVIITSAGSVAGATGTITGLSSPASASFNSVTGTFSFLKDTSKPGKMVNSDILIYEYNNASANPITIKSPASVSAAYSITLPGALPTQAGLVSMSTAGVLSMGAADGTESAPSISFASNLDTGFYRSAANELTATIGGTDFLTMNATGMGVTVGGSDVFVADSLGITTAAKVFSSAGSAATPSYVFSANTTSGMYSTGTGVGFSTGGAVALTLSSSYVTAKHGIALQDGDQTNPGLVFESDTDTGMFKVTPNELGFSTGGSQRLAISSSGLNIEAGLQTASGGFIKFKMYTGSITASQNIDFGPGPNIFGVFGTVTFGSNPPQPIQYIASSTTPYFQPGSTGVNVNIRNPPGSAGTYTYRIILAYE
jgi:hypothetical protein